jgi:hypothetical protein
MSIPDRRRAMSLLLWSITAKPQEHRSHMRPFEGAFSNMAFERDALECAPQRHASCFQILQHVRALVLVVLAGIFFLAGCASTTVKTTGSLLKEPLCQAGQPSISTLVYWGTKWRPDQKEPQLREAAALRGIQDFLNRSGCLSVVAIHRLATEQVLASNEEIIRMASNSNHNPERILLVVVRELGPRLLIGFPVLVEGGTEVLVDVRVLYAATSESLATIQTTWHNGGPFVIKGIKTLDHDMSAALAVTLMGRSH